MGGTTFWIGGLLLLALAGAVGFGVYAPLNEFVAGQLGPASGLAPVGLGILGLACCGLGFIFNSNV